MSYHYASFFLNDVLLVRATVRITVSIPNFEQDLRERERERERERVQIQVRIYYTFYLLIPDFVLNAVCCRFGLGDSCP